MQVVGERDPFGAASSLPAVGVAPYRGRSLITDERGGFRGELASGEPVLVLLAKDPAWVAVEERGRWVKPPNDDLTLSLVRRATECAITP